MAGVENRVALVTGAGRGIGFRLQRDPGRAARDEQGVGQRGQGMGGSRAVIAGGVGRIKPQRSAHRFPLAGRRPEPDPFELAGRLDQPLRRLAGCGPQVQVTLGRAQRALAPARLPEQRAVDGRSNVQRPGAELAAQLDGGVVQWVG